MKQTARKTTCVSKYYKNNEIISNYYNFSKINKKQEREKKTEKTNRLNEKA